MASSTAPRPPAQPPLFETPVDSASQWYALCIKHYLYHPPPPLTAVYDEYAFRDDFDVWRFASDIMKTAEAFLHEAVLRYVIGDEDADLIAHVVTSEYQQEQALQGNNSANDLPPNPLPWRYGFGIGNFQSLVDEYVRRYREEAHLHPVTTVPSNLPAPNPNQINALSWLRWRSILRGVEPFVRAFFLSSFNKGMRIDLSNHLRFIHAHCSTHIPGLDCRLEDTFICYGMEFRAKVQNIGGDLSGTISVYGSRRTFDWTRLIASTRVNIIWR